MLSLRTDWLEEWYGSFILKSTLAQEAVRFCSHWSLSNWHIQPCCCRIIVGSKPPGCQTALLQMLNLSLGDWAKLWWLVLYSGRLLSNKSGSSISTGHLARVFPLSILGACPDARKSPSTVSLQYQWCHIRPCIPCTAGGAISGRGGAKWFEHVKHWIS